ncbi:MAG TPA: PilN domain-containing protein [Mycobacteriales bacterium]|nr:PilN domain-containing protein [Mycobacteriales bacterium]
MTVLTNEHQLVAMGKPTLPRVNLLPPEIAQKRAFRRVQLGMGAAVLASVAVVGGLYVSAAHGVTTAQSDLDAARTQQTALQHQLSSYAGVTAIYNAADAAQAQLTVAMGDEVRYSQLLNDLSLAIPGNVWLNNLSFTQGGPALTAAAPGAVTTTGVAPIGTATFQGVAFSHDDVATWLEALGRLKTYANPYFSSSTEALIGARPVVNFSSTVDVTPTAQSHRYNKAGG